MPTFRSSGWRPLPAGERWWGLLPVLPLSVLVKPEVVLVESSDKRSWYTSGWRWESKLNLVLISQKLTSWKKLWRCRLTAANGNGAWKRIQAHCNVSECVATLPCRASARSLRWLSCRLWQRPSYVCGVEVLGKPVLGTPVILLLLFIRWSVEVLFPFYCMSASWKASYNLLFCLFF